MIFFLLMILITNIGAIIKLLTSFGLYYYIIVNTKNIKNFFLFGIIDIFKKLVL